VCLPAQPGARPRVGDERAAVRTTAPRSPARGREAKARGAPAIMADSPGRVAWAVDWFDPRRSRGITPAWQPGQAEIAAGGGAGRRHAKIAAAQLPMRG
jgi:hypothetical protein